MDIDMKTVGGRIRIIRKKRRLTLEKLAEIINRDKQTIWRWEKAERNVSFKTINLLAEKLDCHTSYLLGQTDDEDAPYEKIPDVSGTPSIEPLTFGENLRKARVRKNVSINELANMLSAPEQRIIELENMINAPSEEELSRISRILETPESEFLKQSENLGAQSIPESSILELAEKILEIDPYTNLYLRNIKPTSAEARFIAAAIRLSYERGRERR